MKVLVFNDFCVVGNCALKINISVLMKHNIEIFPIPTKFFSSLMNYKDYVKFNFNEFETILDSIEKNNFKIDGIYIGLVDDRRQVDRILKYIRENKIEKVVFDPILGDNGSRYSGTTDRQIEYYREILKVSEIITPNLTEAILLTDYSISFEDIKREDVEKMALKLHEMGAKKVVIKSFKVGNNLNTLYYNGEFNWYSIDFIDTKICGTGDAFTSLLTIELLRGKDISTSIKKIKESLKEAIENQDLHSGLNEIEVENLRI